MIRILAAIILAAFALNAHAAVDANQASQADLETVKGIGPGLSGKIVEARKAGEFKSWSDLVERIGGVGPGNAARLSQAGLTVAGAAYDPGRDGGHAGQGDEGRSAPRSRRRRRQGAEVRKLSYGRQMSGPDGRSRPPSRPRRGPSRRSAAPRRAAPAVSASPSAISSRVYGASNSR